MIVSLQFWSFWTLFSDHGLINVTDQGEKAGFLESSALPNLETGSEMKIENRFFNSAKFRNVHVELATTSEKFSILHCVFFPKHSLDLPLLALEMVRPITIKHIF